MTKKINSVCIINCFDTYEHRVDLLLDFFQSFGANVRVITSDYKHFEKCRRTDIKENYEFIKAIPYKKNLSIERLKSHRVLSKCIFKRIENENFDLLWVLVPPNSFVKEAANYKKNHKNVKLVFDLIDLWPETLPIPLIKSIPPFTQWKNLRNKYLNAADTIVTECDLYKQKIPQYIDKSKIVTMYLAREIKEYIPQHDLPNDKIVLCYLGSINNIVDISTIKHLIKSLMKTKPVTIHIIGDGEKRDQLLETCYKIGADVVYHGKVYDHYEKQQILSSCHYGLNIMKKTVFVGLTMKSMDYFEAGLPIINNISGDTWDIIRENNLGFNIPNESIAHDYDESMRLRVRQYFEQNFGIDTFFEKISEIL